MTTTEDVARGFTALLKEGKFDEAGEKYWADDVVSIEPMTGEMALLQGTAAVKAKGDWWAANHEIHSTEAFGPYVNGEQFTVRFTMDVTPKAGGGRMSLDEIGLYTVQNGLIVEERFIMALPADAAA